MSLLSEQPVRRRRRLLVIGLVVVAAAIGGTVRFSAALRAVTPELQQLVDEDQREDDRAYAELGGNEPTGPEERARLMAKWNARHRPRCEKVIALLRQGRLSSGEDYYMAGLLMLHGGQAEDHLLAHTLFVAAALKGHRDSRWYSALALDDFLTATGRPQFFGTTYDGARRVDSTHMADPVRRLFCVPGLDQQRELEECGRRGDHQAFQANKFDCRFD
jgi:hypothetical protein